MRMVGRFSVCVFLVSGCLLPQDLFAQETQGFGQPSASPMLPPPLYQPLQSPSGQWTDIADGSEPEYQWGDAPLERMLIQLTRNTWVRFEYLLWSIEDPGNTLLGSPISTVRNPRLPFPVADPLSGLPIGRARVADLSSLSTRDLNGGRISFGIPTAYADLEASFFTLQQGKDKFVAPDLPSSTAVGQETFFATSTLVNGQIGNNLELYDESFTAEFRSRVWGAEAKVVFDLMRRRPGEGLKLKPLIGFQHLNIDERLAQVGSFNSFGTIASLVSTIDSDTHNELYGGVLGLRTELVHRWFTVGVEPKIMLGVNKYRARVSTNRFRGPGDPFVLTELKKNIFSPVGELGVYARIHLNQKVSLHVSYNAIWATRIARPDEVIFYNDNGPLPNVPGIVVRRSHDSMLIDGLTVGCEIRFH